MCSAMAALTEGSNSQMKGAGYDLGFGKIDVISELGKSHLHGMGRAGD